MICQKLKIFNPALIRLQFNFYSLTQKIKNLARAKKQKNTKKQQYFLSRKNPKKIFIDSLSLS